MRVLTKAALCKAVIGMIATAVGVADEPFQIATKRSDDLMEVKSDESKAVFHVRSPSGISHATIERTEERWPEEVIIHLRLRGLENFKLSTNNLKLEASVPSHDGSVRLWKDGKEDSPLDSKSPYWMEIKILDNAGEPTKTIPLNDGTFKMALPKKFFEGNPKSFKVEWIDFYRN